MPATASTAQATANHFGKLDDLALTTSLIVKATFIYQRRQLMSHCTLGVV
ncbi:hypothetical protein NC997_15670 [Trichocoleus sp. DQ-A2]|nr:hypothetical protein [Coleofasciculus sp. FACHB-T130]